MIILGIETSCDETSAAVLRQDKIGIHILSNVVASSAALQAKYGGVIPEQAAREQIKSIIPVINEAIENCKLKIENLDAIAVTYGPGLIGSLLVGVETAKVLAMVWDKPLIPVNHLLGHFYANWINQYEVYSIEYRGKVKKKNPCILHTAYCIPTFPCLGLLVSGGHTDLVLFTNHGKYEYLGGTRDDAAGECFDKCARLLGLPYPGGPQISKLAEKGDPNKFKLPIPMKDSKDLDFSYSGLKTAVARIVSENNPEGFRKTQNTSKSECQIIRKSDTLTNRSSGTLSHSESFRNASFRSDLAAAIEEAIINSLINKIILAVQKYKIEQLMIAGGVAANQKLLKKLLTLIKDKTISLHVPSPNLCTDNGAMIAAAGFFTKPISDPLSLQADPGLSLGQRD